MNYGKMAEEIPASPIRDMMVRAAQIEDVISFSVGEPDFSPTDRIINAAKEALDQRDTKYAPGAGLTELRQVYSEYLTKQVGIKYTVPNVIVTVGGMSCLFLSLISILNPGDEVLISTPYFSNYYQMVKMCYGIPVPVEVYEKDDFIVTPDAIEKAITPRTKVIMLNSPCNPTGGVISKEALIEIARIAKEHDLFVISDEVYRHIIFDGEKYESIATIPGMAERTMIIDSCSKTFAMTGFRIGFGAGPKTWIELMIKMTEGVHSSTPTIGQRAAIEAFRSGLSYCDEMVREYQKRRDVIYTRLNEMKGISCIKPRGAFYVFANISGTGLSAKEFSDRLLEEAHVAVVPGDNFGSAEGYKYVRMSYATSMENILEGCRRMELFCNSLESLHESA